jgi:hypothetical protein
MVLRNHFFPQPEEKCVRSLSRKACRTGLQTRPNRWQSRVPGRNRPTSAFVRQRSCTQGIWGAVQRRIRSALRNSGSRLYIDIRKSAWLQLAPSSKFPYIITSVPAKSRSYGVIPDRLYRAEAPDSCPPAKRPSNAGIRYDSVSNSRRNTHEN